VVAVLLVVASIGSGAAGEQEILQALLHLKEIMAVLTIAGILVATGMVLAAVVAGGGASGSCW
jgi:hypothetical protein